MRENYDDENNSGIDTPLNSIELQDINKTKIIPSKEVDDMEKQANLYDRMDKHIYKLHAFHLLIGCGVVYLVLVIFEMIVVNKFSWNTGELMDSFVELLKFVISTLIGYVFSETQKHKNE